MRQLRKRYIVLFLVSVMLILLAACGADNEDAEENNGETEESSEIKEVSVGLDPYDYSTVPAYLSQVILEQEGYDVTIEEANVGILFQALSLGEIDAYIDVSTPNLHKEYLEEYGDTFVMAGTLFENMPMGMAVPSYMEDIESIEDIAENPELFNNEIYAIDPGSGMANTTEVMVEKYEMDEYEIKNSDVAAMLAHVESVMEKEEPIVFNAWRPHPMFVRLDIKIIEEDPLKAWNNDDVVVGVVPELEDESPTAFTLFSNMALDLDMVEEWIIEMDEDGVEPRQLAEEWVEANEDTVNEWLGK